MIKINVKSIPHKKQRYNTVGDWYFRRGLQVRVSDMRNWKYELLVAFHEIIETYLCKDRGISEKEVTKFDIESDLDDPGRSKKAPYHKEHIFAEKLEKRFAKELGVDWNKYDKSITEL